MSIKSRCCHIAMFAMFSLSEYKCRHCNWGKKDQNTKICYKIIQKCKYMTSHYYNFIIKSYDKIQMYFFNISYLPMYCKYANIAVHLSSSLLVHHYIINFSSLPKVQRMANLCTKHRHTADHSPTAVIPVLRVRQRRRRRHRCTPWLSDLQARWYLFFCIIARHKGTRRRRARARTRAGCCANWNLHCVHANPMNYLMCCVRAEQQLAECAQHTNITWNIRSDRTQQSRQTRAFRCNSQSARRLYTMFRAIPLRGC